MNITMEYATFGGGCFWCTEALFEEIKGVVSVVSGYSGGSLKNPSYREVCTGTTGHAEVVQVEFDPKLISYEKILDLFFRSHDPTTLNRQGADVGSQYRSVIFYHDETQKEIAEKKIKELNSLKIFSGPIITEIRKYDVFYIAEDYHQDYFRKNPEAAYCTFVIKPKVDKLKKNYSDFLRK